MDENTIKKLNIIKAFFDKVKGMSEVQEGDEKAKYNAVLQAIASLTLQFSEFKKKFDANGDGILSLKELKQALKHPIGKRYFLVFIVIALNIVVALIQYTFFGNPITENTLITLLFSSATVIFAGYIENVNQSLLKEKEGQLRQRELENLDLVKSMLKKESEIEILKERLAYYEKEMEKLKKIE